MGEANSLDRAINDAIDEAVFKHYPDYVAAANISGLVGELRIGVIECAVHYGEPMDMNSYRDDSSLEISDFVSGEVLGLVDLAYFISLEYSSAPEETKKILFSTFLDDMIDYSHCVNWIL
ncbi:MAG: hypothetical protein AABX60_04210 [Nanoarchaeota archaeon]